MINPDRHHQPITVLLLLLFLTLPDAGAGGSTDAVTTGKIWVYFTDHGERSRAELAAAVETAQLSERSLERRRRRGVQPVTDVRDLAVNPAYIDRVRATGCTVKKASKYLNAVSVVATPDQMAAIRSLEFVKKTVPVRAYRRRVPDVRVEGTPDVEGSPKRPGASRASALDYGASYDQLDQINVIPLHDVGINGQGVWIGVLDTGFDLSHFAFDSLQVHAQWDFIFDDGNTANEAGQDVTDQDYHGTEVLSTLGAYAPGNLIGPAYAATFVLAKTERKWEEVQGEEDDFVRALEWADSIGVDIVSSSLGYFDWYDFSDMDGNTAVTTIACDIAAYKGITVCTAAGNERGGYPNFGHIIAPSDGDSVIACGSVTALGVVSSFSSPGPSYDGRIKPDLAARGSSTACVNPASTTAFMSASGTSLSTPLIAGACALVLQHNPTWGPIEVRDSLRAEASHSTNPNNDVGWGIIDTYRSTFGITTAVMDAISLQLSLTGNVVTGALSNGNATSQTVDIARQRWNPAVSTWEAAEIVVYNVVIPGSSSAEFNDTLYAGGVYRYRLQSSENSLLITGWLGSVTYRFGVLLGQSYPNPFVVAKDAKASIPYEIGGFPPPPNTDTPIGAYRDVLLEVYDVRGALVKTVVDGIQGPGGYTAEWNGRDNRGNPVASGVYFYRLSTSGLQLTKKMVLLRY